MQNSQRRIIASAIALSALTISAVAFAQAPSPPAPAAAAEDGGGATSGSTGSGDGMAMCVEGVADCNDTLVVPDGEAPCGVEVVEGEGPDATVSFTPCDDVTAPVPTEPVLTEPTPGMANVFARPFDTATVGADDRTVTIDFVSGIEPCSVLDHVDVTYGPAAVTITLFEGSDPSAGDVACIEIGVFKRTIVTLDEPLEGRTIVDGAV